MEWNEKLTLKENIFVNITGLEGCLFLNKNHVISASENSLTISTPVEF